MIIDFDKTIPKGVLFPLQEIEKMKIIKVSMLKKLIQSGDLQATRVGVKLHIAREELIRYLEENTNSVSLGCD